MQRNRHRVHSGGPPRPARRGGTASRTLRVPAFAVAALALALPAAATVLVAGAGAKQPKVAVFVPDADDPATAPLDGDTWRFEGKYFRAAVRRLDAAERHAFIVERTGSSTDPFATRPDRDERFLTFLVELENRGADLLLFQPQNAWLVRNSGRSDYPLDMTTIRSTYGALDREMPPAYETAGKALFEGELMLGPGERSSGLLVYRQGDTKLKRFALEFELSLPSGERASLRAPYRRVKQ